MASNLVVPSTTVVEAKKVQLIQKILNPESDCSQYIKVPEILSKDWLYTMSLGEKLKQTDL